MKKLLLILSMLCGVAYGQSGVDSTYLLPANNRTPMPAKWYDDAQYHSIQKTMSVRGKGFFYDSVFHKGRVYTNVIPATTDSSTQMPNTAWVKRLVASAAIAGLYVKDIYKNATADSFIVVYGNDSTAARKDSIGADAFQRDTIDFGPQFKVTAINANRVDVRIDTARVPGKVTSKYYVDSLVAAGGGGGWNLTGNAGTTPGTNFIGTTDGNGLMFKVSGIKSGFLDIFNSSTSFGFSALDVNAGADNTAVGQESLSSNTSGSKNTAVGLISLASNITGSNNTAVGDEADVAASSTDSSGAFGFKAVAATRQMAFSPYFKEIKATGIPTGAGYVLTDLAGDGILTLQPSGGGSSSLFPTTGTGTATGNVIGDLDGNNLIITGGNVGIGGSPSYPLQITTAGTATGFGTAQIAIENSDSEVGILLSNSGGSGAVRTIVATNSGSGIGEDILAFTNVTEGRTDMVIDKNGNVGIGTAPPTALLHLRAGTAAANTAPLKLTSGTNLTTPEDGAVEYNGTHFYGTIGSTRYQLDQQSVAIGSVTGLGTGVATFLATPSYDNFSTAVTSSTDKRIRGYQALGSTIIAQNLDGAGLADGTNGLAMVDGRVYFSAVYLDKAQTVTGVKWYQVTQGAYTGDNENRVALYTYSGGTLTQVAASTNDANLWTATSGTIASKAFTTPYSASAGLYFVGYLYNNSAQTTAPSLGIIGAASSINTVTDFTNSAKTSGLLSSQNTIPSSQAMSGITAAATEYKAFLY